jgi:hypothetical protein
MLALSFNQPHLHLAPFSSLIPTNRIQDTKEQMWCLMKQGRPT